MQRLYQPSNLGCKRGVGAAIDWFLAHEESGIILEDDCLPNPDFFLFCAEMLDRYHDASEVMMVGGHNPLGTWDATEAGYVFSRTAQIWGWATWRRASARYDAAMTRWGEPETRALVRSKMPLTEYRITSQRFDSVYEGRHDTWDYGWALAILINGGVSIIPARNLVANIGFGSEATHTRRPSRHEGAVPTHPSERPLRHPPTTTPDRRFERALFKNRFPLGRRLVSALPPRAQDRFRAAVYRLAAAVQRTSP
ncbi:MAG: hemolytic protein HlpA-like protein [Frankiales bacterium]|nr:hemolytic protein HlpA-like protein [Frankiales bacterium]